MSVECGIVVRLEGGRACVETNPRQFCASCAVRGSCAASKDGPVRELWMDNTLGARAGDMVEFSIVPGAVIGASLAVYAVPLVFLVLGIVLGMNMECPAGLDRDTRAVLTGLTGFMLSFGAVYLLIRLIQGRGALVPSMERILAGLPEK
jgi:sigma-E factor negative regulatory protein RseC